MTNLIDDKYLASLKREDYKNVSVFDLKLWEKKYSIKDVIFMLEHFAIRLTTILYTQTLTIEFCKKYMLREDEKYCLNDEDTYITVYDILHYQAHLKLEDFY
tara:strand:+ start:100 stop:405 length:306 start_codon:yes stop_codon:yes gene_type:complete